MSSAAASTVGAAYPFADEGPGTGMLLPPPLRYEAAAPPGPKAALEKDGCERRAPLRAATGPDAAPAARGEVEGGEPAKRERVGCDCCARRPLLSEGAGAGRS
jgi:hypothetical protein